jgi:cytochrome c-type biogenesis protein CcmH
MRLLLAIAITLALAPAAAAACPTVADLEDELICPTCKTTLDQSDAPVARQIKAIVARRVEDCVSKQQIKDELVADFGPSVLAAPPREGFHWLAWVLPPIGLLVAAGVISVLVWRWSRRSTAEVAADSNGPVPLDPDVERRLDRELARYDD